VAAARGLDHGRGRVGADQFDGLRAAGRELAQQVTGPAPDVENAPRGRGERQGQIRGPVNNLVVQGRQRRSSRSPDQAQYASSLPIAAFSDRE
jgi:hypothetical protein